MSANKDYLSLPFRDLLADTAAKSPTPGGGSVAAATGSLAASLACMVLEYTVGKPQFAANEEPLRQLLAEARRAVEEFSQLIAEDMRAYEQVLGSRKLDQAAQDQAAARAAAVPMEIVALAAALMGKLDGVKTMVNPRLLGDLKAAATLASATGESAACTVRDNLGSLPDHQEAARLEDRLDLLLGRMTRHCNAVVHYRGELA